jgi:acetylornithine deacetylase
VPGTRLGWLERLEELIATPSVTGNESAATDLCHTWLRQIDADGLERWDDEISVLEADSDYPGREVAREIVPVVAAKLVGTRPGMTVTLTGHVDTVPPGDLGRWTSDPFTARREGDRLFGRGACDMKAGVIAALTAFAEIAELGRDFAGELQIVLVPGEEDGGVGTLSAIRHGWGGGQVILTEPTSRGGHPQIVVAHGGALTFTVEVTGKSAHASIAPEGENALDHFLVVYRALKDLEHEINARETNELMRDLGTPYATNVGIIAGGVWSASVMEHLQAEVRMGVALGETIADAERRVIDGVMAACAPVPWLTEHPPRVTRSGGAFGSAAIDVDEPLVTRLASVAERVCGSRPSPIGVPYGCDMALWQRVGHSTPLVYGPGDIRQAHAPDEWVSLDQVETVIEVLRATSVDLLGF